MSADEDIVEFLKNNPRSRPTAVANEVGKDITYVSQRLRLLKLQKRVKQEDRGIWSANEQKGAN